MTAPNDSAREAPATERTIIVAHPGLPDLDAALSWVVQTCEQEGFTRPAVSIRPITWTDAVSRDVWHDKYEVSVSQHTTDSPRSTT